ncbi:MAG: alpha/beta hydrolase-fold protein [Pirellulales bacterium]
MNRLDLPTMPVTVPTHTVNWESSTANKVPFRVVGQRQHGQALDDTALFAPLHYESGYSYPLIVWLHDAGQATQSLGEVMSHISVRNYVAVAPRAPVGTLRGDSLATWEQTPAAIAAAHQRIVEAIALAQQKFQVHAKRVFLVGFGAGGTMALRIALHCPTGFAGAATIGGPLPTGNCPLRCVNAIRDLPLLLAASRRSSQYPERELCTNLRLLHSAGATVSLRQYPGRDDLTTQMLTDLDGWMMEVIGQTSAAVVH